MINIHHLLQISFIILIPSLISPYGSISFNYFTTIILINSLVVIIKPIHLINLRPHDLNFLLLFILFLLIYYLIIHHPISLQYPFQNYYHYIIHSSHSWINFYVHFNSPQILLISFLKHFTLHFLHDHY